MPSRMHRLRQVKPSRPSRSSLSPTAPPPRRGPVRGRARRVLAPVHQGQEARPGRPLACRARPGQVPGRAITRSARRRPAWGRRREVPGRVSLVRRAAGARRPLPASQAPAKAPGRVVRPVRALRACPDARVRLRGLAGRDLADLVPAPAACRPGRSAAADPAASLGREVQAAQEERAAVAAPAPAPVLPAVAAAVLARVPAAVAAVPVPVPVPVLAGASGLGPGRRVPAAVAAAGAAPRGLSGAPADARSAAGSRSVSVARSSTTCRRRRSAACRSRAGTAR
jgi:hypothetical protein